MSLSIIGSGAIGQRPCAAVCRQRHRRSDREQPRPPRWRRSPIPWKKYRSHPARGSAGGGHRYSRRTFTAVATRSGGSELNGPHRGRCDQPLINFTDFTPLDLGGRPSRRSLPKRCPARRSSRPSTPCPPRAGEPADSDAGAGSSLFEQRSGASKTVEDVANQLGSRPIALGKLSEGGRSSNSAARLSVTVFKAKLSYPSNHSVVSRSQDASISRARPWRVCKRPS